MLRNPESPVRSLIRRSRRRFRLTSSAAVVSAGALCCAALLAGCGRSAPIDALSNTDGDPDIAGVSVTSPDAVVATESTGTEAQIITPTSEETAVETQATYTVQAGDTLSVIATQYNISIDALAEANAISDVHSITPGQQLAIPAPVVEVTVVDTGGTTSTAQP